MNLLRTIYLAVVVALAAVNAFARDDAKQMQPAAEAISAPEVNEKWMVEGQKRYLTNCGRCHQSPRQFSPREMAMAVRHMRVRAMLTEEDMNYLLYYLTHQ